MKFSANEILIIGDSYCYCRDTMQQWPMVLNILLQQAQTKTKPRGIGLGGCSWWSIRKELLKEMGQGKPKVLIMCHTEPHRIPTDTELCLNYATAQNNNVSLNRIFVDKTELEKITQAARQYYQHLWCYDYCDWAQDAWFLELDNLLDQWQIPFVIHLHCFENNHYIFRNGTTAKGRLIHLTDSSKPELEVGNHMTPEKNVHLANVLYRALLDYRTGLQDIGLVP
jgi:hypothetical protein